MATSVKSAKNAKAKTPKLRLIVEFDVEAAPKQSVEKALDILSASIGETLSDPSGHLYVTYNPDGSNSESAGSKASTYKGPYLTGIKVSRQDAVNKAAIPIVEYTNWLETE